MTMRQNSRQAALSISRLLSPSRLLSLPRRQSPPRLLSLPCLVALSLLAASPACSPRTVLLPSSAIVLLPAEMRAAVDKGFVKPNEPVAFELQVEHNPDIEVSVPELPETFGGLQVIARSTGPTRSMEGRIRQTLHYTLQSDKEGAYILPPVQATYSRQGGEKKALQTQTVYVQVSLATDPAPLALHDIKPLQHTPSYRRWPLILVGLLATLALLVFVVLWIRRRQKPNVHYVAPAHEVALLALHRLQQETPHQADAMRRATYAASEIVRAYVEARFKVNATDMTTEEIFAGLPDLVDLQAEERLRLKEFLAEADRVKYAGFVPDPDQMHQLFDRAERFVQSTVDLHKAVAPGTGRALPAGAPPGQPPAPPAASPPDRSPGRPPALPRAR
jgi:hypothetical protein